MISAFGSRSMMVLKSAMPAGSRPGGTVSATRIWAAPDFFVILLQSKLHEIDLLHCRASDPFQHFYDDGLVRASAFFREEQSLASLLVRHYPHQLGDCFF